MRRLRALPLSYGSVESGAGGIRTRDRVMFNDVVPSAFVAKGSGAGGRDEKSLAKHLRCSTAELPDLAIGAGFEPATVEVM